MFERRVPVVESLEERSLPGSGLVECALILPGFLLPGDRPPEPDTVLVAERSTRSAQVRSAVMEDWPAGTRTPAEPANGFVDRIATPIHTTDASVPVTDLHALDNLFAASLDALLPILPSNVESHDGFRLQPGRAEDPPSTPRRDALPTSTAPAPTGDGETSTPLPTQLRLAKHDTELVAVKPPFSEKEPPGPAPAAVGPNVGLHVTNIIPVNANNDNGSQLTDGIPRQRDFSVNPTPGEKDLVQAGLQFPQNAIGDVTLSVGKSGTGDVAFWDSQTKNNRIASGPAFAFSTFYVEGTSPSSYRGDTRVILSYNYRNPETGNVEPYTAFVSVTITPVIGDFGVSPKAPPVATWFRDKDGVITGINTGAQSEQGKDPDSGEAGATFVATLTRTGVEGDAVFVQNVVDLPIDPVRPHVVYTPASGYGPMNQVLKPGVTFPVLDRGRPPDPDPDWTRGFDYTVDDDDTQTLVGKDAPTVVPLEMDKVQRVDVTYKFKLYLVWRFPDNTLYTLAVTNWRAWFWADTVNNALTIMANPCVVADTSPRYTVTHTDDYKRTAPIINDSVTWQ